MWRSLARLQRVFIVFLLILLIGGFCYAVNLRNSSAFNSPQEVAQGMNQIGQIAVPPENQLVSSETVLLYSDSSSDLMRVVKTAKLF